MASSTAARSFLFSLSEETRTLINNFEDVAPAIAKQHFDQDSNDNMLRRVPKKAGMVTVSQVAMHLPNKEMIFYYFPDECDFEGVDDRTPEDYEPQINVRVVERKETEE